MEIFECGDGVGDSQGGGVRRDGIRSVDIEKRRCGWNMRIGRANGANVLDATCTEFEALGGHRRVWRRTADEHDGHAEEGREQAGPSSLNDWQCNSDISGLASTKFTQPLRIPLSRNHRRIGNFMNLMSTQNGGTTNEWTNEDDHDDVDRYLEDEQGCSRIGDSEKEEHVGLGNGCSASMLADIFGVRK